MFVKKTIYISGPMTGMPKNNFPAFHEAAACFRLYGHDVRNPAEVGELPGLTWQDYMRKDLQLLAECDSIHMLHGWEHSKGAHLELHIAHRLGFTITFQET